MSIERARAAVEANRDALIDLCAQLVAAPSITPPGDTRAVAEVARSWLEVRGITCEQHALVPDKPNLVAVIRGSRPGPQLIFNGHLDTMDPGDEQRWSVPTFELTRIEGRLYGLGMGNMKGGVAAMCLATSLLAERADELAGTVVLTLVSDEVRFGQHGSAHLIDTLPWLHHGAVISAEGSGWMTLAVAEKGVAWIDLEVSGPAGHSSSIKTGTSAVAQLATAIARLDELNDWFVAPPSELAAALSAPEHPGTRVAFSVGMIGAGEARSMLAPRAHAHADARLPPGLSLDALMERVTDVLEGTDVQAKCVRGWEANWTSETDPLVQVVVDAITDVRGRPEATVRHPASDVMRWRQIGVPGLCYGPQPTLSAGIDDYALEQDVVDCASVYLHAALGFGETSAARGQGGTTGRT